MNVIDDERRELDRIELRGLAAHGFHGLLDHERSDGQRFVADVVVHLDTRRAAAGDDLSGTVDYATLAGEVVAVLAGEPVGLLETLAERLAATVLAHQAAVAVDVTVHKPQAPLGERPDGAGPVEAADVAVSVRRDRVRLPVVEVPRPVQAAPVSAAPVNATPAESAEPVPDGPAPVDEPAPLDELAPAAVSSWTDADMPPSIPPASVTPAPPAAGAVVIGGPADHRAPAPSVLDPSPVAEPAPAEPVVAEPVLSAPAFPEPSVVVPALEPVQVVHELPELAPASPSPVSGDPAPPVLVPALEPEIEHDDPHGALAPEQPEGNVPPWVLQPPPPAQGDPAQPFAAGWPPPIPGAAPAAGPEAPPAWSGGGWAAAAPSEPPLAPVGVSPPPPLPSDVPAAVQAPPVPSDAGASASSEQAVAALDHLPPGLVDVVIGLGGNLGPVQETLRWAVHRLHAMPGLEITGVGPLASNPAVGVTDQPDYLNTVIVGKTLLPPRELLTRLQAVEAETGRQRDERWGPRPLDLDIIMYGSLVVTTDDLTLPHPRARERAFVLQPWAAVDPLAVLPGPGGGPVVQLAATAPDAGQLRWMGLDWLNETPGEPGAA
ncbi:MAG: 2-amino-4-hydroxy-6-hydroxymethyldihydropteridine diphosphokinase [Micrococcales bacterium]|nr:2-amino-4-hydroxy-6-hydroxymethyldihydropteridine diphosphokinase [Micrococcales bacterium]